MSIVGAGSLLVIIELSLRIVLETMEGMTPEQKAAAWERHVERIERWNKFWGHDAEPKP